MIETMVLGPGLSVDVGPAGIICFRFANEDDEVTVVPVYDLDPGWQTLLERALMGDPKRLS